MIFSSRGRHSGTAIGPLMIAMGLSGVASPRLEGNQSDVSGTYGMVFSLSMGYINVVCLPGGFAASAKATLCNSRNQ